MNFVEHTFLLKNWSILEILFFFYFTIVHQEEDYHSTAHVIQANPYLKHMRNESMKEEKERRVESTSELMGNPFL
ncbi:hypothetical protein EDM56_04655 [Brevibacillus fluminis]|uniref:Uncharacterized protein n=1 Tax=Brevibacillus fluminis TaxID=511487 RepID=A0A3M8DT26_9BACL|nr:hypothetical protein EDM56_04655 [Brevibacillus fluminis]